jgi:MFS family permease
MIADVGLWTGAAVLAVLLVVVLARELRHVPGKLLVLMATAFVDMAGLFMVVPLLPFYVQRLGEGGVGLFGVELGVGALTGVVVSSFTIAQLVSAPFWGRCSDRFGRRPVMLVALIASAMAYVLFGFADSLFVLVLSRVVQGAGGGTVGVIQAYVADAVEPAQRARALGWLSASTNLGVALGPVLGAVAVTIGEVDFAPGESVFSLGSAAPGLLAAAVCLLNAAFAFRYLKEPGERQPHRGPRASVVAAVVGIVGHPGRPTSRIVLVYAIAIGSAHGINPLLALLLEERFGVTEATIGYLFLYIGSLSVFARVLVLGPLVDRLGEVRLSRIGLLCLATSLLLLPSATTLVTFALVIALQPLGMALTFPCLTSLLSRLVPAHERGLTMGMQQTFGGLARVAAPLLYGRAYDELGGGAPFWAAGLAVLATLLLGIGLGRATRQ